MNIAFYFKNIDSSEALRNYTSEKLAKVGERLHHIQGVDVRFFTERQNQTCEITIHADATVFHIKKAEKDLYAAIDSAVDTLNVQIDKYHKKIDNRSPAAEIDSMLPFSGSSVSLSEATTIPVYTASAKPMNNTEAVFQLRAQKFKFMMFHQMDSRRYSLAYVRPDGNYSIISPTSEYGQYEDHIVRMENNNLKELSVSLFPMASLTVSEAMDEMVANNMEFITFLNDETRRMNVLFQSRTGELALKQPE